MSPDAGPVREVPPMPDRSRDDEHEELLAARDQLIALEAQLGEALGRARVLEGELDSYRHAAAVLERIRRSRWLRHYEPYSETRSRLGDRVRSFSKKFR